VYLGARISARSQLALALVSMLVVGAFLVTVIAAPYGGFALIAVYLLTCVGALRSARRALAASHDRVDLLPIFSR
jgi:hypothetical protein